MATGQIVPGHFNPFPPRRAKIQTSLSVSEIFAKVERRNTKVTGTVEEVLAEIQLEDGCLPGAQNIVSRIVHGAHTGFISYFFCCYHKIISPHELFDSLLQSLESKSNKLLELQCTTIICHWIIHHWDDFKRFKEDFVPKLSLVPQLADLVPLINTTEKNSFKPTIECSAEDYMFDLSCSTNMAEISTLQDFDWDDEHIAQQLTLYQQDLFDAISRSDLIDYTPPKRGEQRKGPVDNFISHFNSLANWAQLSILRAVQLGKRRQVVRRLIRICEFFLKLRNFNGVFSIFSIFSGSAIHRLKFTMREMEKLGAVHILKKLIGPENNHREYRQALLKKVIENRFLDVISPGIDTNLHSVFKSDPSDPTQPRIPQAGTQTDSVSVDDHFDGNATTSPPSLDDMFSTPVSNLKPTPKSLLDNIFDSPLPSKVPSEIVFQNLPKVPNPPTTDIFDTIPLPKITPRTIPSMDIDELFSAPLPSPKTPPTPALPQQPLDVDDLFSAPLPKSSPYFSDPVADEIEALFGAQESLDSLFKPLSPRVKNMEPIELGMSIKSPSKATSASSTPSDETDYSGYSTTAIPHLGILLTDLVHYTDGMTASRGENINLHKYLLMGKAIYDVFSAKVGTYNFQPDKKIISFFADLNLPSEEHMNTLFFETSLYLEPRNPATRPPPSAIVKEEVSRMTEPDMDYINEIQGGDLSLISSDESPGRSSSKKKKSLDTQRKPLSSRLGRNTASASSGGVQSHTKKNHSTSPSARKAHRRSESRSLMDTAISSPGSESSEEDVSVSLRERSKRSEPPAGLHEQYMAKFEALTTTIASQSETIQNQMLKMDQITQTYQQMKDKIEDQQSVINKQQEEIASLTRQLSQVQSFLLSQALGQG